MTAVTKRSPNYDLLLSAFGGRAGEAASLLWLQWKMLVTFFNLKGVSPIESERLADEVVDIAAQRLHTSEPIGNIRVFMYETAKFVWLNHYREMKRRERALRSYAYWRCLQANEEAEEVEKLETTKIDRYKRCLSKLEPFELKLLYDYSTGTRETRLDLAARKQLNRNSLSIRINRIRTKLRQWYLECMQKDDAS
jgi:DNA-directed RNA polymerase specialized sigma24 family protein